MDSSLHVPIRKWVRSCVGCNKRSAYHIRPLQVIAAKDDHIIKDIESILDLTLPPNLSSILICECCLTALKKVCDIRNTFTDNLGDLKQHQKEKRKAMQPISPIAKQQKKSRTEINPEKYRTGKKGKKLVFELPSTERKVKESSKLQSIEDHNYTNYSSNNLSISDIFCSHHPLSKVINSAEVDVPSNNEASTIHHNSDLVQRILSMKQLKGSIWRSFLLELSGEMDRLCGTNQKSVLRNSIDNINSTTFMKELIAEMNERCPMVFDVLVSLCTPVHLQLSSQNMAICTMYSVSMHSRNCQMAAFHKLVASACIRYGAGNGLFDILSKFGISTPQRGKLSLLEEISRINGRGVTETLKNGGTIKITVDNIDGKIKANQVRLGSGNRDFHYTHWSVVVDRVMPIDVPELDRRPKIVPVAGPDYRTFFLSEREHENLRASYSWLIQKIVVEELQSLELLRGQVANTLQHKYTNITDRPSSVYPMFVIMKDPKTLPNCVQIMDTILESLRSYYDDAGRGDEFENTATIPLGGDQLTRVTFDSARQLRAGTHTRSDRFEQFQPVIEELFHVEQDLLEKTVNKFYSTTSSREVGTLAHYRAVLQRTNVNGQVKSTNGFEAHKDFVHTVARAMIVELACENLGLADKSSPVLLPENFQYWKKDKKQQWLEQLSKPILETLFRSFAEPNMRDVGMIVVHRGSLYDIKVPAEYRGKTVSVSLNGENLQISVPAEKDVEPRIQDDVYNYSLGFLRTAMDLMLLHYVIKAGDIDTLTVLLKRLIPVFIGLSSYRSKYAIECINFLTKTECILSDYESLRVKLAAFVNLKGAPGKNKAADMQQENNIKMVKNVIRGLGAGKTDKAMERSSKAAPVICEMVTNTCSSLGINCVKRHSKKSSENDLNLLSTKLRELRPFQIKVNRELPTFSGVPSNILETVNKYKLKEFVVRHSGRAVSRLVFDEEIDDDDDVVVDDGEDDAT